MVGRGSQGGGGRRNATGFGMTYGSTKIQAPRSREAPNHKLQSTPLSIWNLELGISLDLGAWCLVLFPRWLQLRAQICQAFARITARFQGTHARASQTN